MAQTTTCPAAAAVTGRTAGVAAAVAFALYSGAVHADLDDIKAFNIKAQPLAPALLQFSQQADVQVVGSADALAQQQTAGVSGTHSGRQALNLLLANNGLLFQEVTSRSVRILPENSAGIPRSSQVGTASPIRLAQAESSSTPRSADSETLDEVIVLGRVFNYEELESANKMPMSIKDTPQTVKIITQDMLDFAGVNNFNGIYKLDSGGSANFNGSGFAWSYFRGFRSEFTDAFKVDGFRVLGRIQLDFAPYERIEMVKGAVSTMYGQSAIAGTLNAVSKKPQPGLGGSVSMAAGEWNHYRGDIDLFGSLTQDDRLTFRLVGAYTTEDSYLDIAYRDQWVLAPSLKYQFTDDTSLLVQVNYQKFDYTPQDGIPAQLRGEDDIPSNYGWPEVPLERFGSSDWARSDREAIFARAFLEHRFENNWMLRTNLQFSEVSGVVKKAWIGDGSNALPSSGPTDVSIYYDDTRDPLYSGEVNLFGDVELFGREHTLFVGADYAAVYTILDHYGGAFLPGAESGFDILAPRVDYSRIPEPRSIRDFYPDGVYGGTAALFRQNERMDLYGITGQALLRPTDRLTVNLGARYSHSQDKMAWTCCDVGSFEGPMPEREDGVKTSKTTFQGGVIYELTAHLNGYVSYGQAFNPRDAHAYDPADPEGRGTDLGPNEGETTELGLKGEYLEGRLFWSLGVFETSQNNITQSDPEHPNYSIPLGEQRSRGVEADLQGSVLPGWDLYVSATAMDSEFVAGERQGTPSFYGPKFGLSVFSSYTLQDGPLRGFGFGGGVVYKNRPVFEPQPGVAYPQLFGDITEVDLNVFYERDTWRFELTGANLFDERYHAPTFESITGSVQVNPPRRIMAKASYRFGDAR